MLVAGAGLALSASCSDGESALVLGKPLPQLQAGAGEVGGSETTGGTAANSGGAGATAGSAVVLGGETSGGAGATGGVTDTGGAPDAGAAGAGAMPIDPPWVAALCTPAVEFMNTDATAQGQIFTDAVPDPVELIQKAAHASCRTLYRAASEVHAPPSISLIVEDNPNAAAYTSGNTVHLSTNHLKAVADRGGDVRLEVTGIFHFAVSLEYEYGGASGDPAPPVWLIVGIADYVRLESGYLNRAARMKAMSYSDGSQVTAFFLDYLQTMNPDIVYELNQRLAPTAPVWSNDVFASLMGSDIDTLWAAYEASF